MTELNKIALMAVALAVSAPADTFGVAAAAQTQNTPDGPTVSVVAAEEKPFTETILVTGSLVARQEVLVSPQIDGYRIGEVLAEVGDRVEEGQLLARLADEALQARLAQLEASRAKSNAAIAQAQSRIVEAEANKKAADSAFERAQELLKSRTTSRSTYDEREAAARTTAASLQLAKDGLEVAKAEKMQIEAQVREAKLQLSYTEIKAPAAGIISRRTAKLGALASSQADALFRIIAKGEIELDAEVPEIYLPRLAVGQTVQIDIAGLKPREGTVRLVSPEVDATTRLGKVRIFIGAHADLRVGSFARGTINASKRHALSIPSSAILNQDSAPEVKLVKDNRVITRKVSLGMRTNGRVEIVDGLQKSELVVSRAGMLLRDGDPVRPVQEDGSAASGEAQ